MLGCARIPPAQGPQRQFQEACNHRPHASLGTGSASTTLPSAFLLRRSLTARLVSEPSARAALLLSARLADTHVPRADLQRIAVAFFSRRPGLLLGRSFGGIVGGILHCRCRVV